MLGRKIDTNFPEDCVERWAGESWEEYFIRLFENKSRYKLTHEQIAQLLNSENGKNFGESAYRKEFAAFNRGRIYEREHSSEYIAQRILSLSDFHIPYQLPIETFKQYAGAVDTLVLNGDVMDCQSISFFPKVYRINFVEEMITTRDYLISLIELICPKKVIIVKGNHEHRMIRYLSEKLNEDLLSIMPDSPLELIVNDGFKNYDRFNKTEVFYRPLRDVFEEQNIIVQYNGNWYVKVGNVIFAHPLMYSSGKLRTIDKAVTFFTRSENDRHFTAIVMGHTHKIGYYKSGDISMYEQGCCCKLNMLDYTDGKLQDAQQNGYMYICLDKDGNIIEDKTKLITTI